MKTIGFLFADEMEFKPFLEHALQNGGSLVDEMNYNMVRMPLGDSVIYGIQSGLGKVNAAAATSLLVLKYGAEAVLSAGLSGAISHLHKGDIVAGSSYVECDFDLRAFGCPLGQKLDGTRFHEADPKLLEAALSIEGVGKAAFGTGDFFLTDPATKDFYKDEFGIQAFDMETAACAAAAGSLGVPFLSVRKISDDADDSALDSYHELNNLAETALSELLLQLAAKL